MPPLSKSWMSDCTNNAEDLFNAFFAAVMSSSEIWIYYSAARASTILHKKCLRAVFRAPMSFFDTNPIGRVLSRFSQDLYALDVRIPQIVSDWLWCLCDVIIFRANVFFGTFFRLLGFLYYIAITHILIFFLLQVISTILIIGLGTPIFFALVIPIGIIYYWMQVCMLTQCNLVAY